MAWTQAMKKYAQSDLGKQARLRYQQSEKGKQTHREYLARRKAKRLEAKQETVATVEKKEEQVKIKKEVASKK